MSTTPPRGHRPHVVVFDIDGTLLTTGGAGAHAWAQAFEVRYGVTASITDYTEDGMPDQDVCRATYRGVVGGEPTDREVAQLMASYLAALGDAVRDSDGYRVLPGVVETLDALCEGGALLGLTTGNVESAAHVKLARGGLNTYFTFGGFGSDSADRGILTSTAIERAARLLSVPLSPATVKVVGDTPRDVDAARAAGAVSVGVATGHYGVEELRAAGADHVLASLRDPFPLD